MQLINKIDLKIELSSCHELYHPGTEYVLTSAGLWNIIGIIATTGVASLGVPLTSGFPNYSVFRAFGFPGRQQAGA